MIYLVLLVLLFSVFMSYHCNLDCKPLKIREQIFASLFPPMKVA